MGLQIGIDIAIGSGGVEGDVLVDNLELETGDDFLLEDGGFILLES